VIVTGAPQLCAHEPDGRFTIDSQWLADAVPGSPRPLRVSITAVVPLKGVTLTGRIPSVTSVSVRALRWAGAPDALGPWPDAGIDLGSVNAGQRFVFDLEVVEPIQGGGLLVIGVDAADPRGGDKPVHEGVGITVGLPGIAPVLRHGALEFPAERGDPAP
jgi:hypothetical protein